MSEEWLGKVMDKLKIQRARQPRKEEVLPVGKTLEWKKYGRNW